jgi:hypothetical protein
MTSLLSEAHKCAIIEHVLSPHEYGFASGSSVRDRPKSVMFRYDHDHYSDWLEFESQEEALAFRDLADAYAKQVRDFIRKSRVDLIFEQVEAEVRDTLT